MKRMLFLIVCLALLAFATACVDDNAKDNNSETDKSGNILSSMPDIEMPDPEDGKIDGSNDAKNGGFVDDKRRSAYDENYMDGYDNNFGGAQNGVTDGGIMDGGIPGSPDYMP